MKRFARIVFSAALLGALTVGLLPERGNCQMAYGAFFAAGCRMPCCKTQRPMPNCPLIKATAPRDFIASAGPILKVGLIPVHFAQTTIQLGAQIYVGLIASLDEVIRNLVIGPPPSVRAPPSNLHLLSA